MRFVLRLFLATSGGVGQALSGGGGAVPTPSPCVFCLAPAAVGVPAVAEVAGVFFPPLVVRVGPCRYLQML